MRAASLAGIMGKGAPSGGGAPPSSALAARTWSSAAAQRLATRSQWTLQTHTGFFSTVTVYVTGGPWDAIKLDFCNISHPMQLSRYPSETVNGAVTIVKVWVIRKATGQGVAATFAGARGTVVAVGAKHVLTDEILPAAFGLSKITPGEYEIRVDARVAVGSRFLTMHAGSPSSTEYDPAGSNLPNVDSSDSFYGTRNIGGFAVSPVVVGRTSATRKASLFVVGDSLLDQHATSWAMTGGRSMDIPLIEMSLGGSHHGDLAARSEWRSYMDYCDGFVESLATNDPSNTSSYADYWAAAKNTYAHRKIAQIGGYPRTPSSSDSWATPGGQTKYPGGTWWDTQDTFFSSKVADGTLMFARKFSCVRDPGDSDLWLTNGTPYYATIDGLHHSEAMVSLLAAEAAPWLVQVVDSLA